MASKVAYDHSIKLLLIGDSSVGKSCLLLRYCDDYFRSARISTIGVDFKIKFLDIEGKKLKLQIWDTAGQERFRTMTTAYYRGAHGIVLVYDVCDRGSFDSVSRWVKQIDEHAGPDCHRILVANKIDFDKKDWNVPLEEGQQLANQFSIPFFPTSAKTNEGVPQAFEELAKVCMKSVAEKEQQEMAEAMKTNEHKKDLLRLGSGAGNSKHKEKSSKRYFC